MMDSLGVAHSVMDSPTVWLAFGYFTPPKNLALPFNVQDLPTCTDALLGH